jgi:hypothetical protein
VKIMWEDNRRGLQSVDVCSQYLTQHLSATASETVLEYLDGVGFSCDCSDSGSASTFNCQSEGEICCDDICGTVHDLVSDTYENATVHEQVCVTFSAPADLAGQQRCVDAVYCGGGSTDLCSCEADVNGQRCSACDICKQPTQSEPVAYTSLDCTNIPGLEDFPTDCESYANFLGLEGCMPSTSAAHPSTTVILPAFMAVIFVALSSILW